MIRSLEAADSENPCIRVARLPGLAFRYRLTTTWQAISHVKNVRGFTLDAHASRPQFEFDDVKRRVSRGEIFDSSIVDLEKSGVPAQWTSSFGPEVCLQSVDEYVRSTFDIDKILSLRQSHSVMRWCPGEPDKPLRIVIGRSSLPPGKRGNTLRPKAQ